MSVTISKKGWIIETTNTCLRMLEQGGVSGRRELVTFEQLSRIGVTGEPEAMYNDDVTNEAKVRYEIEQGMPPRILARGHRIN